MEEKIMEIAESLINAYRLKEELYDKSYWINRAHKEAGFIPAEADWIHVEVTMFKIEVSVHHKNYGGGKYWINGVWLDNPFDYKYPSFGEMLAKMKAW